MISRTSEQTYLGQVTSIQTTQRNTVVPVQCVTSVAEKSCNKSILLETDGAKSPVVYYSVGPPDPACGCPKLVKQALRAKVDMYVSQQSRWHVSYPKRLVRATSHGNTRVTTPSQGSAASPGYPKSAAPSESAEGGAFDLECKLRLGHLSPAAHSQPVSPEGSAVGVPE